MGKWTDKPIQLKPIPRSIHINIWIEKNSHYECMKGMKNLSKASSLFLPCEIDVSKEMFPCTMREISLDL